MPTEINGINKNETNKSPGLGISIPKVLGSDPALSLTN